MKNPCLFLALMFWGVAASFAQAPPPAAQARLGTEAGFGIFQQQCLTCHGKPNMQRAPSPAALRDFPPEKIYEILTSGGTNVHASLKLSDEQKRRVSESVSGRLLGSAASGDAKQMPNHCSSNPPLSDPAASPAWNGWGVDVTNTRFQPARAAGLTAKQVPRLKLKWAFGYPGGLSAFGQPSVVSGRVFVGTDTGFIYSLDAASGCLYWSFQTKAGVRNAMTIGPVKGHGSSKYAVYFGDLKANAYGLDAQNGELLWTTHVDGHLTARITAAPTYYDGRLYVPVSSWEEFSARTLDYPCCTFRGSVLALDANTGKQVWKTYVIPEEPKPTKKNSTGTQLWAPGGASVWNSPTVDIKRHAVYVGTGDSETEPAAKTSDAVMALDMSTGKILWTYQAEESDAYLVGCGGSNKSENCPTEQGPDYDIGNSPILKTLANGKRILVTGTKNGFVFGLDPDRNGALLWKVNVAPTAKAHVTGIVWGGAADAQNAYFGLVSGGVVAVQLATGERLWYAPLAEPGKGVWNAAAATAIPGVVFASGGDGNVHALSASDGHVLWEYATAHDFDTVNKVSAQGGSIRSAGVTIAGGMLFVGSGYGVFGGLDTAGNVLLAFAPE
jgi:polyvinyl alcohol dehydrogenase (cytochrome)